MDELKKMYKAKCSAAGPQGLLKKGEIVALTSAEVALWGESILEELEEPSPNQPLETVVIPFEGETAEAEPAPETPEEAQTVETAEAEPAPETAEAPKPKAKKK